MILLEAELLLIHALEGQDGVVETGAAISTVPSVSTRTKDCLRLCACVEQVAALLRIKGARRLVEAAAKQIGASVEGRGESSYSLELANGKVNTTRVSSVHKYLEKLVKKKAESAKK